MYRRVWALDSDSNTSLRITVLTATLYTGDYFVPPTPARHSDIIYYSTYNKILCTDLCQYTDVRLFTRTLVQFSRTISACIFPAILISPPAYDIHGLFPHRGRLFYRNSPKHPAFSLILLSHLTPWSCTKCLTYSLKISCPLLRRSVTSMSYQTYQWRSVTRQSVKPCQEPYAHGSVYEDIQKYCHCPKKICSVNSFFIKWGRKNENCISFLPLRYKDI